MSHPVWVCGLKRKQMEDNAEQERVTPCMGVWIETYCLRLTVIRLGRHTLYGCVD